MKFNIRSQKIDITEAIKEYTEEKLGRLDKYLENPSDVTANVLFKVKGKEQTIEVTIPIKKVILRSEVTNEDLYASIDLVSDKLERQIRKNKTKIMKRKNNVQDFSTYLNEIQSEQTNKKIIKRKQMEVKPMSEDEAILQMELIDHDFFIYKDDQTGETAVLYKRKESDYGIIEIK